ncbi:hypothetical protein AGLY_012050 [Aphis glycines]|uniref:Uncharacterized protein n=1 Tax=Aphis glycines TaxID=307491 RepID=A0A6G0T9C3_APHGL|nr:hypothetical protein AGLY_012050 [Aphis glycines]
MLCDNQVENRQQSVCQRFPGFVEADRIRKGNDGVDVERAPHAQDAVVGPGRRSQSADGRRTGRAGGQVTAVPAGGRGRGRRERPVRSAVRHIQRGRGGRRPTPVEPVGVDAGPGRPLPAAGRGRRRRSQRHGRGRSRRSRRRSQQQQQQQHQQHHHHQQQQQHHHQQQQQQQHHQNLYQQHQAAAAAANGFRFSPYLVTPPQLSSVPAAIRSPSPSSPDTACSSDRSPHGGGGGHRTTPH